MYSLEKKKKKETLLGKGTAINNTNMGQPHPHWRPRKARPTAQPPAPRSPQPDGPSKCKPAPLGPHGLSRPCPPLAFAPGVPTHACREGRRECVSGKEKREERNVLFN